MFLYMYLLSYICKCRVHNTIQYRVCLYEEGFYAYALVACSFEARADPSLLRVQCWPCPWTRLLNSAWHSIDFRPLSCFACLLVLVLVLVPCALCLCSCLCLCLCCYYSIPTLYTYITLNMCVVHALRLCRKRNTKHQPTVYIFIDNMFYR